MESATAEVVLSKSSDPELMESFVNNGNRSAIDALYSRHFSTAVRVARLRLGKSTDAEDVVHTAFVKLISNAEKYRRGANVRSWIMSFVINTCRNKIREDRYRTRREQIASRNRIAEHCNGPGVQDRELYQSLLNEIRNLPEQLQTPLWLRFVEGHPPGTIAAMLNYRRGTVRSRLSRGLSQLRHTTSRWEP